jgi:hypothetical protein
MNKMLMTGFWRYMLKIPPFLWEKQIEKEKRQIASELGFMTEEHRLVHHFVVRELPYLGKPMSGGFIADNLGMTPDRVNGILGDLEKNMTFLFRNGEGEVVWAYPVTVETTPHQVTFNTGEKLFAA